MKDKWISVKNKLPEKSGYFLVLTRLGNPFHLATYNTTCKTFAPWYEVLQWKTEFQKYERHKNNENLKFNERVVFWIEIPEFEYLMRYPKNESA